MNWNKAKNYTILFLIIINAFLFSFTLKSYFSERLSNAKVSNITAVLNQRDISVETDIPKNAVMLPQLVLNSPNYDYFKLTDLFFGSGINVKRTEEFNKTIFNYGSKTLIFNDDAITFNDGDFIISDENYAAEDAKERMEALSVYFPGFVQECLYSKNDEIRVEFYGRYKNSICFNNYCVYSYSQKGFTLTMSYGRPVEFDGAKSQVCTADIALYSFMNKIREKYPEGHLTITQIITGYYVEEAYSGKTVQALPYYKIYVKEKDRPFYVNGYNGEAEDIN